MSFYVVITATPDNIHELEEYNAQCGDVFFWKTFGHGLTKDINKAYSWPDRDMPLDHVRHHGRWIGVYSREQIENQEHILDTAAGMVE